MARLFVVAPTRALFSAARNTRARTINATRALNQTRAHTRKQQDTQRATFRSAAESNARCQTTAPRTIPWRSTPHYNSARHTTTQDNTRQHITSHHTTPQHNATHEAQRQADAKLGWIGCCTKVMSNSATDSTQQRRVVASWQRRRCAQMCGRSAVSSWIAGPQPCSADGAKSVG